MRFKYKVTSILLTVTLLPTATYSFNVITNEEPKFEPIENICDENIIIFNYLEKRGYKILRSHAVCNIQFESENDWPSYFGKYDCLLKFYPTKEKFIDTINQGLKTFVSVPQQAEIIYVGIKRESQENKKETSCILKDRDTIDSHHIKENLRYYNTLKGFSKTNTNK